MKRVLLVLLFLMLTPSIFAYKGRVFAQETKQPATGIAILNSQNKIIAVSDADGRFEISVKKGEKITFRGMGYENKTIVFDDKQLINNELVVFLSPSLTQLEEVVVTTTRKERPIKDEPVITHIFTSKQIEKLASTSFQDVLTSIIPGVQFESQRTNGTGVQSIRIQGLGGSYIMFLLDGEPISSKNGENFLSRRAGQIDFSRIDINNIERIEYLPSGGSILHGSNSIGGVVNIITKKTTLPFQLQAGTRFTLPYQNRYEFSGGASKNKADIRFNASYTDNKAYDAYTDEKGEAVTLPGSRILTAAVSSNIRPTDKIRFRTGGNFSKSDLLLQRDASLTRTNAYVTQSGGARAGMQWQLAENQMIDLSGSVDLAKRQVEAFNKTTQQDFTEIDYKNTIGVSRLQYNLEHNDRHTTIAGVENTHEYVKTQWLKDKETGHTQNTAVIYAQHDAKFFNKKFFVSYGLRYDHNSTFGGHFLQRASLMQKIGKFDVRLLYSESFRSPSLTERFAFVTDPSGSFVYEGNPELKPETSRRYTFQTGYTTKGLNISASVYRADVQNIIENQRFNNPLFPTGFILKGVNTDSKVSLLGGEAILRGQFSNGIYSQASYSYTNSISRTVTDIKGTTYNTSLVRPHSVSGLVGYSFSRKIYTFDVNLSARYMAEVSYWRAKASNDTNTYDREIKVRDARGTGGFLTYYNVIEDAYSNVRLATSVKFYNAYTLQLGVDNLLGYQPNSSNFTSALTSGRQYFVSFFVDIDKIKW